ncbi:DUF3519 domain-containing protein, partial [Helicobacter pylori]|uniref:DUF3519 domain-containing protein n=1 Tax=Helicobacter pylori TaxID=210 RepID=UPI002F2B5274
MFKGELDSAIIKGRDLEDLYLLESGAKKHGAKKILIRHYGVENTGGLTNEELLNMSEVIKNGSVLLESFERIKNGFRYAYEWDNNGVKLRLVVDDLNNGNKIFDFYSDRNFKDFRDASLHSGNHPYEPNPTQKPLTSQEDLLKTTQTPLKTQDLSPLEQANAEKLAKLESERLASEQEFLKAKEQEIARKEASEELSKKARDFSNEKLTNEQIKELLNNAEIPTSGRDAITFGTNNLNPEIVEFLHKNNKKMIIEKASNKELELLKDANFKHPENIRASLDHDAIAHILKRHGVNSVNVKNGEIPITNEDIANYRYIVNNADAILRTIDKYNKEAITAFKQVNGYAVVVEQAINKKNELVLKTMFKSNGSYKDNDVYKKFSSTSLNANAKVPHRLSSYSGATENTTQKPLTSQEDLLKTSENLNQTPPKTQDLSPLEQANAEKLAKLESERLESEKEFLKAKEQEQ